MKKWLYLAGAALALIAIIWFFTRPNQPVAAAHSALMPQVETIKRGDLSVVVSATGIIEPINKVEIKSKASGLIEELKVNESDIVHVGDLIARLDQKDTKNAYDQAVANLDVAKANLEQCQSDLKRKQDLFDKGLLSAAEFDVAKLAVVTAQASLIRSRIDVDNSDIRLKETVVRSPIDGIVLTKDVEVGQIISSGISSVSGGTLIATLADMKEVYVKADVDEVDIGQITPGMKASVVADAYPDKTFHGQVIRIAAQSKVTSNVTTFEVTIKVANPQSRLKAGMNTSVDILVADKKNVVLVPNEALMADKEIFQEMQKLRMTMNPGQAQSSRREGGPQGGRRQRPEGGEGRPAGFGGGEGRANQPADGAPGVAQEEQSPRRGVILKIGDDFRPRMVRTGVSNYDYTEVMDGLKEGDEVVYAFMSRAKQSSDQMRQRMSQMSNMNSGFRSSSSSSAPPSGGGPR